MTGKVFVGTSGWQYPNWRGSFYPQDLPSSQWLKFYSQYFETVEVNSSFYHQTRAAIFEKWQGETPPGFVFAVKGHRFITHIKRLKDCQEPLKVFFKNAGVLRGVGIKHVILWQLPPSLKKDIFRLESFLKLLPKTFRSTFEFRHQTWMDEETWGVLSKYNAAAVFQDWPEWPQIREVTADFVYCRFHGNKVLYTSSYTDAELKKWAKDCRKWLGEGKDVYAYFNNDAEGFAVPNAQTLKKLS